MKAKDEVIALEELIAYEALVENPRDMEQRVHSNLRSSHESKEFFRTTPEAAVAAIRAVANEIGAELQLERDDLRAQGGKLAATPEATCANPTCQNPFIERGTGKGSG